MPKRSHRVIDCACCDLQPEFFEQVVEYTTRFLQENNISVYDEESGKGLVRHLYLRYGETTDRLMVCLVVNGDKLPCADRYIEGLRQVCGRVCSVVLNINREQSNVILGKSCRTLWGSDTIEDSLCGVRFELSPLSFYQVNRAAAEQLYLLAAQLADFQGGELLVDLYCGAGTIGLTMAHRVGQLVGVEIVPDAVENAKANAKRCGIENARFLCADAKQAAVQLAQEGSCVPMSWWWTRPERDATRRCWKQSQRCLRKSWSISPATAQRWQGTANSWRSWATA